MLEFLTAIKATHDLEGRPKGSGVKGKTEIMQRNSTLLLCGQKIGSWDDNSITTRSICEKFLKPNEERSEQQVADHRQLKDYEAQGLSSLLIELLSHRMYFQQRMKEEFVREFSQFQKRVFDVSRSAETRILKSLTVLKLCYKIIGEKIQLPLSAEEVEAKAFGKALEMQEHLQTTDGLSEFWKVIEYLLDRKEIEDGWDFKIESKVSVNIRKKLEGKNIDAPRHFIGETKIIYIRLSSLVQAYSLHMNRTGKGIKPLSEKTIETYMSSQPYWVGLCPGTVFKSIVHGSSKNTSCYVLEYERLSINLESTTYVEDRIKETVSGIITKGPEKASTDKHKFVLKDYVVSKKEEADKTEERYTTCYCDEAQVAIINGKEKITAVGMVELKYNKYRNMDVMELWPGTAEEKPVKGIDEDTPF